MNDKTLMFWGDILLFGFFWKFLTFESAVAYALFTITSILYDIKK